jgi:hypothetical protein
MRSERLSSARNQRGTEGNLPDFPQWDIPADPPSRMSMDDYLEFVQFCWDNTDHRPRDTHVVRRFVVR